MLEEITGCNFKLLLRLGPDSVKPLVHLSNPNNLKVPAFSTNWTRVDSMVAVQPFYSPSGGPATPATIIPLSAVLAHLTPSLHI